MTRSTSSPLAVSMMMGMFDSARSARQSDSPSSPGSMRSSRIKIDPAVGQDLAHGPAIRRRADPETLLGQRARDEIADFAVIVDDQDVRCPLHGGNIDQRPTACLLECVTRLLPDAAPDTLCHKKAGSLKNLGDSEPLQCAGATDISVA